jgi:O-antigen/teichoic acid export membrane protein
LRGSSQAALIVATVVYMFGFALDVSWYLRALERMRLLLVITVISRLAGLALLWSIVTHSGDLVEALWSYTFVAIANAALGWSVVVHQGLASRVRPQWRVVADLLRRAWAIVFGNLGSALLTNGGVALLGFIASPAIVGAANLALRIKMAGQATLLPSGSCPMCGCRRSHTPIPKAQFA